MHATATFVRPLTAILLLGLLTTSGRAATSTPVPTRTPSPTPVPAAREFYVNASAQGPDFLGTADYPWTTINAALLVVDQDDIIRISGGTYQETIRVQSSFRGGQIFGGYSPSSWAIRDPISYPTIIHPGANLGVGMFNVPDSLVDGLTIENARLGVRFAASSGTVRNLIIRNCGGNDYGGGVEISGGNPTVVNCLIERNFAVLNGGGIAIYGGSNASILNNTLVNNSTTDANSIGGGISVEQNSSPVIEDNILVGNTAPAGCTIASLDYGSLPVIRYNLFWPAASAHFCGNLTGLADVDENRVRDPLFVSTVLGDYYLSQPLGVSTDPLSPAVDSGSVTAAERGLEGGTTRVDGIGDAGRLDRGYHQFDVIPPAAARDLRVRPGKTWMTLDWTGVEAKDFDFYDVYVSTDVAARDFYPVSRISLFDLNLPISGTSMQFRNLKEGATHFYRVRANDRAGNAGSWGIPVGATTTTGAPAGTAGVAATGRNQTVELTWTAQSGATGYNVYRSTLRDRGYSLLARGIPGNTYLDTGVQNGTAYYYRVGCVNAVGESLWSAAGSAIPLEVTYTPTLTPTNPATITPTVSPSPSSPADSPTPTPTVSPTPTATRTPGGAGVVVKSRQAVYHQGDTISMLLDLFNQTGMVLQVNLFLLVEIQGEFFFWPAFTRDASPVGIGLIPGTSLQDVEWLTIPLQGEVPAITLTWYGALLDQTNTLLIGDLSAVATRLE